MDKHQTAPLIIIVIAAAVAVLGVFHHTDTVMFASLLAFAGSLVTGAFAILNSSKSTLPDGNTTSTLTQVTVPPPAVAPTPEVPK